MDELKLLTVSEAIDVLKEQLEYRNLEHLGFDDACLQYIAENCNENIRVLKGYFFRVVAEMRFLGCDKVDLEFVKSSIAGENYKENSKEFMDE